MLKRRVDEELTAAVDYLYNVDYSINWGLVTYEDVSRYTVRPLFRKVFYNGRPVKLIVVDARLNGRTFVDLDSVSLSKKNTTATTRIVLQPNEYFVLDNVDIEVQSVDTIES